MAKRPIFIPTTSGFDLVHECMVDFHWSAGFSEGQKKKNVRALHEAAKWAGFNRILEISSKSDCEVGRRLSAFSLKLHINGYQYPLESVYQGSKVFENGGPFHEIFEMKPIEAKKFIRELELGRIVGYEISGSRYPLSPKNAFYDWLYIKSLVDHSTWIEKNVDYDAYTDIEFNPEKQINCQARAFAELKSLAAQDKLSKVANDFDYFASLIRQI